MNRENVSFLSYTYLDPRLLIMIIGDLICYFCGYLDYLVLTGANSCGNFPFETLP